MAQIIKLRFNDAQGVEQISFPISVPEAILFKAEGDKAQQNLNEVIAAINTSITNIATEIGNSGDAANKEGSIYAQINNLEQIIAEITGGDVNSIAAQIAAAIQGLGSASNGSLTAVTVGVNTEGKLTIAVDETALNAELAKFDTTLGVTRGGLISTTEGYAVNADSTVKEAVNALDRALKDVGNKVDAINVGVTSFDGQEGAITIDNDATGIGNVKFECGDSKELKGTVDVGVETFKLSSEQESVDNVVLYDVNDWAPETGDASDYTNADVVFKHNEANDTIMGVAKIKNVNYEIKSVTPASANVKEEYEFQKDGVKVGDSIKIYKDASLKSVELVDADSEGNAGQFLKFTHILADGTESDTYFNVSRLLVEAEFKNGLQVNESGEVSVKVDPASEEFLTVGADGVKLSGVQDAIDTVDGKLTEHKNNTVAHITAEERAAWNAKVDFDVLKSVNYELDLTIFE